MQNSISELVQQDNPNDVIQLDQLSTKYQATQPDLPPFRESPVQFIIQKWFCKRKRSARYNLDNEHIAQFDERRLIDARFWVFFTTFSNLLFQAQNITNPLPETRQFEVNQVYFLYSFFVLIVLAMSRTNMNYIIFALYLTFIRQLVPLFDPEQRKEAMGSGPWNYLVCQQCMGALMNLVVILNCIDRYAIPILLVGSVMIVAGILEAVFGLATYMEHEGMVRLFVTLQVAGIAFIIFIYIQKRLHKEVFFEAKQKLLLQNEFKTIFDEFDSGVFILKNSRVTRVNLAFKWFILQNYGPQYMQNISAFSEAYELNEMKKENEKEAKSRNRCRWLCSAVCCWSANRSGKDIITTFEQQSFDDSCEYMMTKKLFTKHLSSKEKAKKKKGEELFSLRELASLQAQELQGQIFRVVCTEERPAQYFQLKKKQYCMNNQLKVLVQLVDVSQEILFEKVNAENEFLSITNATVSHELRNPLQSILSQNLKVGLCLRELIEIVTHKRDLKVAQVADNLKQVVRMMKVSTKIQESSANIMNFLVDDLLDFSQINAGKFRSVISAFNLKEAIEEVLAIQKEKAEMRGISLSAFYKPQLFGAPTTLSFFSKQQSGSSEAGVDSQRTKIQGMESATGEGTGSVDYEFYDAQTILRFKDLKKTSATGHLMVSTDRRRLQQVLLNLQSNALKFTEKGGKVSIFYSIYKHHEHSYLEVQVKDTGLGIKRQDQAKLFKLFGFVESTQEVNTRGIGLGLVISQRISECFSGQIGFKSAPGVGSTFAFRFQLDQNLPQEDTDLFFSLQENLERALSLGEDEENLITESDDKLLGDLIEPALPPVILSHLPELKAPGLCRGVQQEITDVIKQEEAGEKKTRIMVVDDEPFNIESIKIMLQCALANLLPGFDFSARVDSAGDGIEAVTLFKEAGKKGLQYELILMDCNMPKMDGYTATQEIKDMALKRDFWSPHVIAVTAHSEEKYVQRCLESGMDQVIPKPARLKDIEEAVASLNLK